ncbi:hypothetical protein [Phenylobacterium sp.]|uniref:hypothetical protein n=1 Tax=Phenylobacterium sp. TaxID=1871053 RepID=UPI0025D922A8|nr:hypothetical protein [Phenylobacterium sp.]MBX3483858.1 hypothetical protein [Phenylobacterium sp.]MCW5759201.1 hypothetical protein [Phenylobacterium sp.]
MGRIAVGEAIGAGFGLIRREPLTFLAWCALYFLVSAAPQAIVWPQMMEIYRTAGSDPAAALATPSSLGAYQPIAILLGLALMVVAPAAIFRSVLFPDERRFFYLRLGMRELWTTVVSVVVVLAWLVGFLAFLIPILVVTFGAAAVGGAGGALFAGIVVFLGYVAAIVGSLWLLIRLSLGPVMSFAENTFRLTESWRLTKGHAWRIFLVALGLFAMVVLLEAVLFGGAFAVFASGSPNPARIFSEPGALPALMSRITVPVMLVGYAVFAVFGVWSYVMGAAAWANIYRQLKPELADTFA